MLNNQMVKHTSLLLTHRCFLQHVPLFFNEHHFTCSIIFHHLPSCSIICHHFPSFSIIFHHFPSFSIIFYHFPSFSIIFHHFPSVSSIFHHFPLNIYSFPGPKTLTRPVVPRPSWSLVLCFATFTGGGTPGAAGISRDHP